MNLVQAMLICLGVGIAFYGLVSFPMWFVTSLNRGCIWRLRDQVSEGRRQGRYPNVDQADELIHRAEVLILLMPEIRATRLWWRRRSMRAMEKHNSARVYVLSPDEINPDSPLGRHEWELTAVVLRQYLFGSWSAMLFVLPRNLAVLTYLHLARQEPRGQRAAVEGAAIAPQGFSPRKDVNRGSAQQVRDIVDRVDHAVTDSDKELVEAGRKPLASC
jgi:hypothetical protein